MAVYVITWNLNIERVDYSAARRTFVAHLERLENVAEPGLESVRWVASQSSAQEVSDYLRLKLDANDRLFISKLQVGNHQGWLSQSTWNWINARL